jgi:hypothetical protein
MPTLRTVNWLKVVEGRVDGPFVAASRRARSALAGMGAAIGGTDDAVALYIKLDPRPIYRDETTVPGAVAGILWLAAMPPGRSVEDYREDGQYEIGWPVRDRDLRQGPALKPLMQALYGRGFDAVWSSMRGSMTGGRPFRIDAGPYERLGEALTDWYSR